MRLSGLDASALALALLAVTGVLLLLYLQGRPARRVSVPSLALWQDIGDEGSRARAMLSRRELVRSFLLALAIASALVLALGQLESGGPEAARNVVLALDCSASMAARDVVPSRLERAKSLARQRVQELAEHDHAWVVALAGAAVPVTSQTSDKAVLLQAIDRLSVRDETSDLTVAAELALDLLAPFARGELWLFSDGAMEGREAARRIFATAPKLETHYERVGESARNVALTQLAVRPYLLDRTHQEVLISLENSGARAEPLTLQIESAHTLLHEEQLTLEGGRAITRVLSDLPASAELLSARISLAGGVDASPQDDRVELRIPAQRRTRVLAVSAGNRYLEAALLLDDTLDVRELAPADYRDSEGFDVVIFDGVLPSEPPHGPALYLGASDGRGAFPLPRRGELVRPFFDHVAASHPLVRGLALGDVNVARAVRLELLRGDVAVAATAGGAPLLVEGTRVGKPFVALAFELRDSDLPLRAAFPLLFLRALSRLRDPLATGSPVRSARGATDSAIAPRADLLAPSSRPTAATSSGGRLVRWSPVLLLLALLLLTFEWLSFHRGWTA
ncbi:MAG: hypothetical protein JWN04_2116 [Myxococcaceae bacterium]|nr:hypothetical protein [Myxococcaceae bacterium]